MDHVQHHRGAQAVVREFHPVTCPCSHPFLFCLTADARRFRRAGDKPCTCPCNNLMRSEDKGQTHCPVQSSAVGLASSFAFLRRPSTAVPFSLSPLRAHQIRIFSRVQLTGTDTTQFDLITIELNAVSKHTEPLCTPFYWMFLMNF